MSEEKLTGWTDGYVGQSIGARDEYQQFIALAETNRLDMLVTDRWIPFDQPMIKCCLKYASSRVQRQLRRYYSPSISSGKVKISGSALAYTALLRNAQVRASDAHLTYYYRQGCALGRTTGHIARLLKSAPFAFSYYGKSTFDAAGEIAAPRILFQVHPHASMLQTIYKAESLKGEFGYDLLHEAEVCHLGGLIEEITEGAKMADFIITASTFTKETLLAAGMDGNKIAVVPYGVDLKRFHYNPGHSSGPFRFLFVGQPSARKGLEYLFGAWRRIALKDAELVVLAADSNDQWLLRQRRLPKVQWLSRISDAELAELYGSSDIFLLPSLVEGFGLVLLEALACGTPFVSTTNTGAVDILKKGNVGLLAKVGDVDDLADKLLWCYHHRGELHSMRPLCRKTAEQFSWERFRSGIRSALSIPEPQKIPQ
jgi:glycosyltransferase involved in cell wall biosynthesis